MYIHNKQNLLLNFVRKWVVAAQEVSFLETELLDVEVAVFVLLICSEIRDPIFLLFNIESSI